MIEIDLSTGIIMGALLLLALVGSLVNPMVRRVRTQDEATADENREGLPPMTILITIHDNAGELEKHLPLLLEQDYPDYRVIVVGEQGDADTEDVLKRFKNSHGRLYYTLIPESSRYMSRPKLQVTLGVKAARTEWVLLMAPTVHPSSDHWLEGVAKACRDDTGFVLGCTDFPESMSGYKRFEHFRTACYNLRRAQRSKPFATNMPCVCFRKSQFMRGCAFQGNAQFVRSEFSFLVNKYAAKGTTRVAIAPQARAIEDEPYPKNWKYRHLYHMAARKSMAGHTSMALLKLADHLLPHLSLLSSLGVGAWALHSQQWVLAGASLLALLLLYGFRVGAAFGAAHRCHVEIPAFVVPLYELTLVWHSLYYRICYWKADKRDFTSHKL